MRNLYFSFSTMKPLKQAARICLSAVLVFFISVFSVGFYQFASQASKEASLISLPKADAIVVLTGEASRIHSAVDLLQTKHGKRLLISGVSNDVSDKAILSAFAPQAEHAPCCIDLDRLALDTRGNAEFTAQWAELHGFKRVIVVTSGYHMPRSMDHLRQAMPTVDLIPASVTPTDLKGKTTFSMMTTPKVIIEYGKFLLTRAHLEPVVKYMWTSLDFRTNS